MPDTPDADEIRSVQLDPFPILSGDNRDRTMWLARHYGTPEAARVLRTYPHLADEARRIAEHQERLVPGLHGGRFHAAAERNQRAATTARSEALRMDPAPHLSFDPGPDAPRSTGERRTTDPDLTGSRRERDADRREEDVRAFIRRTAAAALSGREAPQPVEIVRPRHTPAETVGILVGAAVNLVLCVAAFRYAARTLLGVELSRRGAVAVILAGQSLTPGAASSLWTRAPRTPRSER